MDLAILSVNIGGMRIIGSADGEPVLSGIDKRPVAQEVVVRRLGIEGDAQADLTVHGGLDKAVYAYPSRNWPWWKAAKQLDCAPATFGENLTLDGCDEDDVAIGDRFRWGDAVLEISQPRAPCYKLAIHTGRPDVPQAMTVFARCGWYCRVVEEGRAQATDTKISRVAARGGPSVRDTFRALFDPRMADTAKMRVLEAPELAESWRRSLLRKLQRRGR
jgi:MOSC domain-containing protein YiiM